MKIYIVFLVILTLFIGSCAKDNNPTVTVVYDLDPITSLVLSISGNVRIIEGTTQRVEVTGSKKTVDRISKSVRSGIWRIELLSGFEDNYDNLEITITSNEIENMINFSSGHIFSENILPLKSLRIAGSGSFDVKTKSVDLHNGIDGSGIINISGTADRFYYAISGSGDYHGFNLVSKEVIIMTTEGGNTEITATDSLDVRINGWGNVYYKGDPSIKTAINGTGTLINSN